MANDLNIKILTKEYFVTLDKKPVCPPFNDEPGNDKLWYDIYQSLSNAFGKERVEVVCVTTFDTVKDENE